ncbi:MAG: hypothetical protein F6J97_13005 [Leptolyngbya sp. SIO4C1]|nr:hypothetical protein [Leptolyngbya sp. SIO4C1]
MIRYLAAAIAITVMLPTSGYAAASASDFLEDYRNTDGVPTLALGATGEPTADIQRFLAQTGRYSGPIDGIYGTQSAQAVAAFQAQSGLTPDGIVGLQTWRKILQVDLAQL